MSAQVRAPGPVPGMPRLTSHVGSIAPNPRDADLLLVGIELGGLMRSVDRGASWQDHRPGAQRDVHSLAWHPRAEGRAYEAGGGGRRGATTVAIRGRRRTSVVTVTTPGLWRSAENGAGVALRGRRFSSGAGTTKRV